MARSKNLHFVQHTINIEAPNDPGSNWAQGTIQVDQLLSQELGRTIRNGNTFRLVGYGANLRGYAATPDQDIGFAGVAGVIYCPVTKNGVGAWQSLQKQWMKQKQLSSGVGKYVRYDDFELGWSQANLLAAGRNSTILMGGIGDVAPEHVGLYGTSVDGAYVSLETYYDNLNPIPEVSEDPFGAVIKTAKFTDKFPNQRTLLMPTAYSANVDPSTTPDTYAGAIALGDINWLPSDNHLSHMTGSLYYYFKGVGHDTGGAYADTLSLTITLVYEGWAPLAKTRSARGVTRPIKTTAASGKNTTRAKRRS